MKTEAMKDRATTGLVPKLRFPEFRDAEPWKPVSLGKASTPITERVGARKFTPVSISAGIGFVPQAEKFGRDISGNQYQLYTLVSDGETYSPALRPDWYENRQQMRDAAWAQIPGGLTEVADTGLAYEFAAPGVGYISIARMNASPSLGTSREAFAAKAFAPVA